MTTLVSVIFLSLSILSDASLQAIAKMRADDPGTASHQNSFSVVVKSYHLDASTFIFGHHI